VVESSGLENRRTGNRTVGSNPTSSATRARDSCAEAATHALRVSVVVPVRNGAATIGACIESLIMQTYPKHLTEIIVVDNESTDSTRSVVARYPVTLLLETSVLTSYAARNRGIAHAGGDVVALTDSDCVASPDWLTHILSPLNDPAVGAVLGTVEDARPESLAEEFTARVKPFASPTPRGFKSLLTANVAIRAQTLRELGGFDERLPTGGDVDFGWRLQQRSHLRLHYEAPASVFHRHRSTFRGVFEQFRRYGLSEILLTTLYHGGGGSHTAGEQFWRMLSQTRAMASYVASFVLRAGMSVIRGFDRRYILWPLFLFVAELGNVVGKVGGLIATRYYRHNPYANPRIARS
jgi:glycosyltransferase involved in cell wall biosynthesis